MTRLDEARALRVDTATHYNCCQSVLVPFRELCGLDRETAYRLGAHFGAGMRMGSVCGVVTGALMVLGLAGGDEAQAKAFRDAFKTRNGALDCAALLTRAKEQGIERKCHCDGMIDEAVALLEQLLGA